MHEVLETGDWNDQWERHDHAFAVPREGPVTVNQRLGYINSYYAADGSDATPYKWSAAYLTSELGPRLMVRTLLQQSCGFQGNAGDETGGKGAAALQVLRFLRPGRLV